MTPITRLNWKLPLLLYLATWLTTTFCRIEFGNDTLYSLLLALCLTIAGTETAPQYWIDFAEHLWNALLFSSALMFILTCHELGHYFQSLRYRVRSSLPDFLPLPIGPFGTFGAVIAMDGEVPNSRALFDIGITGPLAGLIPTLVFLYFGIQWSQIGPRQPGGFEFGDPLLVQGIVYWIFGRLPPDMVLYAHPVAFAAWAGLLLTSLNLMPFSQLDGGHVFYAMLGRRSIPVVHCIFAAMIVAIAWFQLWHWSVLLLLIALIGISHPPTANDRVPLNLFRHILGWATLLFVLIGFVPTPLSPEGYDPAQQPVWYC
jgi:membrane-associated protease RseP (regulator of RpoE activity)